MVTLLKQSTAITLPIGPFVDATDGFTEETALTLSQADHRLSKNGGAFAQKNESSASAHMEHGWYAVALDATDTGTLGNLSLYMIDSGARAVWRDFQVVPAQVYNSLILGSDVLDANVSKWNDTAVASPDTAGYPVVTVKDGTGTGEINTTSGEVNARLSTQGKADVNAEVIDVIATDTHAEIGQEAMAATQSYGYMVRALYKALRNKWTITATLASLFGDDAATVDQKFSRSDDNTTYTKGEIASGP